MTYKPEELSTKMILLQGSTTAYLESQINGKIKVKPISNNIIDDTEGRYLSREALLYYGDDRYPILYGNSLINTEIITQCELDLLMEGDIPIGTIFKNIEKKNLEIAYVNSKRIENILNIHNECIVSKQYVIWDSGRKLGSIIEYFNEESLIRTYKENNSS